ncbi:MAG: hypothetical protein LUO94_01100 [Methylococcaceae bacterium]|nr:hypothetical protein [Methylococcaceae bacterium]
MPTFGFGGRYPRVDSRILGVLACFVFWFLLFYVTGLFSSAFHLIDEHILMEIHVDLAAADAELGTVIKKWVVMDFNERRFRPLYYTSRVLRAEIFGLSWPAWSLYNAFLAASTSAALFLFGTLLGFTTFSSLCLAALSTLGRPSSTWWWLGTPEAEANFLLALAFLCVARAVTQGNARTRNELAAIVLSLLASLTKEGMILYLPAIAAIRVWLPCWLYGRTLKSALLDAWPFIAALGFIAVIEILCLLLTVGTSGTGYAGVDAGTFDLGRIRSGFNALAPMAAFRILTVAMAIALLARVLYRRANTDRAFAALVLGWLVFLIGAVPQVLLYSKSGWVDHYFNPVVISCALLLVLSVEYLRRFNRWIYLVFAVFLVLQINQRFKWTRDHARHYASEGVALQQMLRSAMECMHDGEPLLLVANPRMHYEEAFSLRTYLAVLWKQDRIYLATVGASGSEIFSNALSSQEQTRAYLNPKILEDYYFRGDTLSRLTPVERERLGAIVILSPESLQNDFLAGASDWLQPGRYRSTDFDLHAIQMQLLCMTQ